jgi:hypothetical protein
MSRLELSLLKLCRHKDAYKGENMTEKLFTDKELQMLGGVVPSNQLCNLRRLWFSELMKFGQSKDDIFRRIDEYYEKRAVNTTLVDLSIIDKDRYKYER